MSFWHRRCAVVVSGSVVVSGAIAWRLLQRDRWHAVRCHRWSVVRDAYRRCAVYHFVWKLERAARQLPAPARARASGDGGVVESIVAAGPKTYQGKASNVAQIESLLGLSLIHI